jgi:hypothetical protein
MEYLSGKAKGNYLSHFQKIMSIAGIIISFLLSILFFHFVYPVISWNLSIFLKLPAIQEEI